MKKLKIAVIGATGFAGEELVKLLVRHPKALITYVSGRDERDLKIQEIFPYLQGHIDLPYKAFHLGEALQKADFFFLSLPHTVSMEMVPSLLKAGKKVVDVSADYRLKDTKEYETFYHKPHLDALHLKEAVYGLPEINRSKIKKARLIANPGCYPTSAILALLPGLKKNIYDTVSVVIDAKSGVTGAGRGANKLLNYSEVNESFKAYKVFEHQHVPEINQTLREACKKDIRVIFVPHLLPINRGILTTIYLRLKKKLSERELISLYKNHYKDEPFVKVYDKGLPEIKHVAYTNFCDIGIKVDESRGVAVIVSVIDNLQKGAAGQAIQNMNIMAGFEETLGL